MAAEVKNNDQDSVNGDNLGDSTMATRGQADDVIKQDAQPHVAKKPRRKVATRGQQADVVDLATERDKRVKAQQPELATRGQKMLTRKTRSGVGNWYVEPVKASVGTWAFRLRRHENGGRSKPIYVSRVADVVYEIIRSGDYEAFKQQLIASHNASAIRSSNRA